MMEKNRNFINGMRVTSENNIFLVDTYITFLTTTTPPQLNTEMFILNNEEKKYFHVTSIETKGFNNVMVTLRDKNSSFSNITKKENFNPNDFLNSEIFVE